MDDSKARGTQLLRGLQLSLSRIPGMYQQVVYFGNTGSGKSTMLYQLEQRLRSEYRVVRYSTFTALDVNKVTIVDVIYSMFSQVFNAFSDQYSVKAETYKKIFETWFSVVRREDISETKCDFTAEAGIKANLKVLFANIKNLFSTGNTHRVVAYDEVKRKIPEYIGLFNELIAAYTNPGDLPILIMIEDIEKSNISDLQELYFNHSIYFKQFKVDMLLTAPASFRYTPGFNEVLQNNFTGTMVCPMLKVKERTGAPFLEGIKVVKDIITTRIDANCHLIDEDAIDFVISYSGGVLRDAFELINVASLSSELVSQQCITDNDVKRAINRLRSSYLNVLRTGYFQLIQDIYRDPDVILDDSIELLEMIKSGILLEYMDDDLSLWLGVHPIVIDILTNKGVL